MYYHILYLNSISYRIVENYYLSRMFINCNNSKFDCSLPYNVNWRLFIKRMTEFVAIVSILCLKQPSPQMCS